MRSESPEKRGRQKVVRPPTYRIENEYNPEAMPQYFQILVDILEGRKLAWGNPLTVNSYVILVLGKKKHRTSIRRNMREPLYREAFVFELYTSILDLRQSSLWLAVMEPRCCAPSYLLGEANIDLGSIWIQPNHQALHKWVQLCSPGNPTAGAVGFVQLDVSIIFRGETQVMSPTVRDDKLEDNLLLPFGSEQQCANYLITIYGAFGLPNGSQSQGDKRFGKPPSTFVKASFCGLVGKTATLHRCNNPMYCEQISMIEMFPNMSPFIRFEVCSAEGSYNRILACAHLKLGQISHDGENGFLPMFGPSLLHVYGTSFSETLALTEEDGPYHRGALFIALKTTVPFYHQAFRTVTVEPVTLIRPETLWPLEDICILCPIFEVSLLDCRIAGKFCGVAVTIGEVTTENKSEEFSDMMNDIRTRKMHYTGPLEVFENQSVYGYLDFCNSFPVLQFATRLPDFRFRMYRNNMVAGIIAELNIALNAVERRLKNFDYSTPNELIEELNKALDDTTENIRKFLDIVQFSTPTICSGENMIHHYSTELDQKQLALQREEMENILQRLSRKLIPSSTQRLLSMSSKGIIGYNSNTVTKKTVKLLLAEMQKLSQNLKELIFKTYDGWPDIVVWLLNGGSRVAYTKIPAADVIHSLISEQNGKDCGSIQTVYMKPLKCPKHVSAPTSGCHCIVGKVELLLWLGLYRQRSAFESYLPSGYQLKVKGYDMYIKSTAMMIECRAFIYKAKIRSGTNEVNSLQTFVRINALSAVKETKVKSKTLSPIWNQVLKIHRMVFTTPERLSISPPIVLVEVNNTDLSGKSELIGRLQIQPKVDYGQDLESPPKLHWYDMYREVEGTGQVLMSVHFIQVPERVLKTIIYNSVEESFHATAPNRVDAYEEIELLPSNILPVSTSYKVDVYWWGLRNLDITKKPGIVLEIEELSMKSEVILNKRSNCNFSNGRVSQLVEAPLNEVYCSPLSIKLFDTGTFGRTLHVGTKVVNNPTKYIVNWLPKNKREASLKRVSIISTEFALVNQVLLVKKTSQLLGHSDNRSKATMKKSLIKSEDTRQKTKWYKLWWGREPDEEECTLLSTFPKKTYKEYIKNSNDEGYDWWLKYRRSEKDYNDEDNISFAEKMIIYTSELEAQSEFSKFRDWCSAFKLYNGQKTGVRENDEQLCCGMVKLGIAIYRWPPPANVVAVADSGAELNKGYFDNHPSNDPATFLIRVYLVKGFDLKTKESIGKSDPYVILNCGKNQLGDRYNYVPNTFNPIFGSMYEFRCNLPEDYLLTISVYNYERSLPDELIGSTIIDLEDRIYTRHRARVGLPNVYSLTGKYKWRDCVKPSAILEELCLMNHFSSPTYIGNYTVMVNGVEYKDNEQDKAITSAEERKENLCLSILRKWYTLPICGYHLVPEHIETRTLYNRDRSEIDHGKLHMWVDIFPLDAGVFIPPSTNITPESTEDYELRITVFSVRTFTLETDYASRKITDFYVRAFLGSAAEQSQRTDVHYKCLSGESNFNWRMIFNFRYQRAIGKIIRKEKGLLKEYEESVPPLIIVQLMDHDAICPDDYLGSLMINLNAIPRGMKHIDECTLDILENPKKIDLFSVRSLRAWWPLSTIDENSDTTLLTGKINLEITLLLQENANLMPVGFGRQPPSPLPEPMRTEPGPLRFCDQFKNLQNVCRISSQNVWIVMFCVLLSLAVLLTFYVCKWHEVIDLTYCKKR